METNFNKPLEQDVAENAQAISDASDQMGGCYFKAFTNVNSLVTLTINGTYTEQTYMLFGSSSNGHMQLAIVQRRGNNGGDIFNLGNNGNISISSMSGTTTVLTLPTWFRGCVISMAQFTASVS